jgi:16S rRNA (cytosine967-C5)-methyltransferase
MKTDHPQFRGARLDARSIALLALLDARDGDAYVQEILDTYFQRVAISALDRRLATQLACGIMRRRQTLDALLRPLVRRPPHLVEPFLWELLRLGAFQLAFLDQVPPHAAIHATVELVKDFGRPWAKGFVNAVLRGVQRLLADDRIDLPSSRALPLDDGRYRVLTRSALPDPATRPGEYLAAGLSLPSWLVHRWLNRWGWDETVRLGFWFQATPPLTLRVNPLRIDRAAFLQAATAAGFVVEPGPHPQAVRVGEAALVRALPGYDQGWFSVQDASAMEVATMLEPRPGWTILDLCAAPGGKTTHLAELMGNRGKIVACDIDSGRLRMVDELCQRLGTSIVQTRLLEGERDEDPPAGSFDAVLVDVPCSNTGVLGRRPEARWRIQPTALQRLIPLQTKLLLQAAERVRPGGVVVYSTCSIEPDENEHVVRNVARSRVGLKLEVESLQSPGRSADGGYWAKLRRG